MNKKPYPFGFFAFLWKPYPLLETFQERLHLSLILGLVVFLVLYAFTPFGLKELPVLSSLVVGGYGMITVATTLAVLSVISYWERVYCKEMWNIGLQILLVGFIVLCITLGNYHFHAYIYEELKLTNALSLGNSLLYTFTIGAVPVVVSAIYVAKKYENYYATEARKTQDLLEDLEKKEKLDPPLCLKDKGVDYTIPLSQVVCIHAQGNYIRVVCVPEVSSLPTLFRASISDLEEASKALGSVVRVHRSWLVNLSWVENQISGESSGYYLKVKHLDERIPVARRKEKLVLNALKLLSHHKKHQ